MSKWPEDAVHAEDTVLDDIVEEPVVDVDDLLVGTEDLSFLGSHEGLHFLLDDMRLAFTSSLLLLDAVELDRFARESTRRGQGGGLDSDRESAIAGQSK